MNKDKEELARLLHDFKSPLSTTRLALNFIIEEKAEVLNEQIKTILQDILKRNQDLLDKITKFEKEHG